MTPCAGSLLPLGGVAHLLIARQERRSPRLERQLADRPSEVKPRLISLLLPRCGSLPLVSARRGSNISRPPPTRRPAWFRSNYLAGQPPAPPDPKNPRPRRKCIQA